MRHVRNTIAEKLGVRAARLEPKAYLMGPRVETFARLVEGDVPVGAQTENLQINTPSAAKGLFVTRALFGRFAGRTIERVSGRPSDVDSREQVILQECVEAVGIGSWQPEKLVQTERRDAREINTSSLKFSNQRVIDEHWGSASSDSEHEIGLRLDGDSDSMRNRTSCPFRTRENSNVHPGFYSS